ncbi:MAG: DUF1156 domain-containing protein, partial [Desulfurococcaceae archaeon]
LPVAAVFLKAVLEIPRWIVEHKLEKNLVNDVEKWGLWILEELRKDPAIRELYDEDVAVYIGTWEVKCPYCGRYTPLVGNWWLARVKDKKKYKALAWMKPVKNQDGVSIEVVEIVDPLELETAKTITRGKRAVGVKTSRGEYIVGDPRLSGEPNINARRTDATCLNCYSKLKGTKDKWIIKDALKEWNTNLEKYLKGEITLEELKQTRAKPRILVKVKTTSKQLIFEPATQQDNEKLWKALEKLKQIWRDPDIPTEPLPPYGSRGMGGDLKTVIWGLDKWYKHFNPRQLLTLVKLVKLIREAGRRVEEEKLKQGWDKEKAHKYAEAITTYLAIALCKHGDFNSIVSHWTITWLIPNEALAMRGIAMVWNWGEYSPYSSKMTGTYPRNIEKIIESLRYLINAVSGSSSRVEVVLDDATVLSKLRDEKFDLVITDPPYRDDVPYAELSDFYYVWLKRALSNSNGASLVPRFYQDFFFPGGVEVSTQWEWFASREVSLSTGRCVFFGEGAGKDECERVYRRKLSESFKSIVSRLKEDGLLVTYFAQSSPEAWISLIEAGLSSNLYPFTAFPVITESEESVVARGKSAITASIVIAWRRIQPGYPLDVSTSYSELVETASKDLDSIAKALSSASGDVVSELYGVTIYVMAYARVLSLLTMNGRPVKAGKQLSTEEIVKLASEILAQAYAKASGAQLSNGDAIFYYLVKRVFPRSPEGRRLASSGDLVLLSYGLSDVQRAKVLDEFVRKGILRVRGKEKETEVASRETYILVEPRKSNDELELGEVLKLHGVYPENPATLKSPVHVLHALMLYSLKPRDVFYKYYEKLYSYNPVLVSEAVELAKALSTLGGDPESELASRVLEYLGSRTMNTRRRGGLLDFTRG